MKAWLTTIGMAMVPVIELRGAIPVGVSAGLDLKTALFLAVVGNLIPIPFLLLFLRRILSFMRSVSLPMDNLVNKLEARAWSKRQVIDKYEWLGLVMLVAIPLPGTGAWTGALVASVLDMRMKRAMPAIALGVVIAGIIVTYITYGASSLLGLR